MPSIANILLQVTGDSDDARRELEAVSRDLAIFGRETAEAEAEVDTTGAKASLEELKARLAAFSVDDHSTEVNVLIAKAQADLAVLQAELTRIDSEEVTVDVDVRRGIVERIASLTGQIDRLGGSLDEAAGGGIASFVSGIREAFKGGSLFSTILRLLVATAPVVLTALVALGGSVLVMAASFGEAVLGAGALATALGATLLPAFALIGGAVANFKEDSETAGTAAFALKENVEELASVFVKATSGGADALFRGLSDAVAELAPMVRDLGPAFTQLGQAGAGAIRSLAREFTSAGWEQFFRFITDSLAELTPLFARSFGAAAKIMANIAQASMPFLIEGFRSMARALESIAEATSDIDELRKGVGGLVDHLKTWLDFGKSLGEVFLGFLEAAAPQGQSFVEWLTKGATAFAAWERSKAGREAIRAFFKEVLPTAKEAIKLFFNVGETVLKLTKFFAPLATAVLAFASGVIGAVNDVIDWLTDLDRALAFSKWGAAFSNLAGLIGRGFTSARDAVVGAAEAVVGAALNAVREQVGTALATGRAILNAVRDGFNATRGAVVTTARAIAQSSVGAVRALVAAATAAGSAIFNAVRSGFNAVRGGVLGVARSIATAAVAAVRAVVGAARSAGSAVINAVAAGISAARSAVVGAARDAASAAVSAVRSFTGAAQAAGSALINGVADGMRAAIGAVVSAARAVWDAINAALPDITINIDIPKPSLPDIPGFASGVRNFAGGLARVGEDGEELAWFPPGTDIFSASDTRSILSALARGASAPLGGGAAIPVPAGAGGGDLIGEQHFNFITPGTGNPDPRIAMAQAALIRRQKGRR